MIGYFTAYDEQNEAKSDNETTQIAQFISHWNLAVAILLLLVLAVSFWVKLRGGVKAILTIFLILLYIMWFVGSCMSLHFFAKRLTDTNGLVGLVASVLNIVAMIGLTYGAIVGKVHSCDPVELGEFNVEYNSAELPVQISIEYLIAHLMLGILSYILFYCISSIIHDLILFLLFILRFEWLFSALNVIISIISYA